MARTPAHQAVAEYVRELVAQGEAAPGDRLPTEPELAAHVGVSRSAVREAVKALVAEGLVVVRHGHGTFVAEGAHQTVIRSLATLLNLGEISQEEIQIARQFIEPELAAVAARCAADEDLAGLRALVRGMQEDGVSFEELGEMDNEFHRAIAALSGSRVLVQVVGALRGLPTVVPEAYVSEPERMSRANVAHEAICDAIAARDPERARAAMLEHLRQARASTQAYVRRRAAAEEPHGRGV